MSLASACDGQHKKVQKVLEWHHLGPWTNGTVIAGDNYCLRAGTPMGEAGFLTQSCGPVVRVQRKEGKLCAIWAGLALEVGWATLDPAYDTIITAGRARASPSAR